VREVDTGAREVVTEAVRGQIALGVPLVLGSRAIGKVV
jgi:hypothetical protein